MKCQTSHYEDQSEVQFITLSVIVSTYLVSDKLTNSNIHIVLYTDRGIRDSEY